MRRKEHSLTLRMLMVVGFGALLALGSYQKGAAFFPAWGARCLWVLPLWVAGLVLHRRTRQGQPARSTSWSILVLLGTLVAYLFSRSAAAPDFFFLHWAPSSPWSLGEGWIERALATGAVVLIVLSLKRRWLVVFMALALIGIQLQSFLALMDATGGAPMYRIDHPSFFYRLWSFGQTLPRFIYYDPFWNGGSVNPYLVASGVLTPGLLLWPVWKFLPLTEVYTPTLGFLFLLVVPLIAAASCRALTRNRLACVAAAFMGLGTSHFYAIHLVNYGTFGSLLCAAFLMPLSACLYRLVILNRRDRWTWLALVVSGACALCWPPLAVMALPLSIPMVLNWRRLDRHLVIGLAACALGFVALFSLPALSILHHSRVLKFAATSASPFTADFLYAGFRQLGELLRQSHPVILFAGILAPLALPLRSIRRWFVPLLVGSLLMAAWGQGWKHTLQLERIWINALFIGVLPSSLVVGWMARRRTLPMRVTVSLLCGLLLMGGYNTVKIMGNKGRARFNTMTPELKELVKWVRDHVPSDGRVMFAGAAVHGYSGGKVASLPIYTGREMLSCDYYGFSPKLVEYNYPPKEFRHHGPEKLFQFMDLYNVTHIITYHEDWKAAFRRHSSQYEEVMSFGKKTIFRVKRESSMFIEGQGIVEAGINQIVVSPADRDAPVVIKYNWVDGITCTPKSASIEPWDTGTSLRLIRVDPCGAETVTISYKRWF